MNMTDEDISQEFRLKKIKVINSYFIKEIDQNELTSNKKKEACATLTYIEHFLTLFFEVTVCISIFAIAFFVNFSTGITSSTAGLNF